MSPDDYKRMSGRNVATVEERAGNPFENPMMPLSGNTDELLALLGVLDRNNSLPPVSIEAALEVPAVLAIVGFLSRTMASLDLHVMSGTDRVTGEIEMLLNEAPNPQWGSWAWRRYLWQQVFTGGRGLSWIERAGNRVVAIWPMDPTMTSVRLHGGRKTYVFDGKHYPAEDVIDVPFMLKANQIECYSPIYKARKAIALAIAMGDFAGTFFAGGGVPPLALEGPMPAGTDAFKRAQNDIKRAIDMSKQTGAPFFGMPPGHALKPIGFDPAKGQMVEARLFQIQEMSRIWSMPPVFVQDLSKGTFSNTTQQDLQLSKHVILHWAKALEDELNLKLFSQRRRSRRVVHNREPLERADWKTWIEGNARAIQTGQLTPNETRETNGRSPMPEGDKLYIQGATVPLGTILSQKPGHDEDEDEDVDPKVNSNGKDDANDGEKTDG